MSGPIPSSFIDQLLAKTDIVEVIDRLVPLKQKGREFMACCPFHDEKTPSFSVSPEKQFYHCFGCGAHGTAIGFLMEYQNLGFVEAVEDLADRAGLEIPRSATTSEFSTTPDRANQLLETVQRAKSWFQQQLQHNPEGQAAMNYLRSRGLDKRMISEFGIGYAPNSWNGLTNSLGKTPTSLANLLEAGLISRKDDARGGERHFDRFRGRVMFPIEDHRGRVVGFGGRDITDKGPKYLNSPETPLFHKGRELYGLHRARRAIGSRNRSIVVEGYMDAVSLVQFEVDNVVAALGTATTPVHVQRLFRLAPDIVFCFDGDRAGRDAAWKALKVALAELRDGRQVSFLFLEEGEDPDTAVRADGAEGFLKKVDSAIPLPDFLFENLMSDVDMGRMEGRARLSDLAKPLLSTMPVGALKAMLFDRLSTLCGVTIHPDGTEESSIPRSPVTEQARRFETGSQGQLPLVAQAVSLLLQHPDLAAKSPNTSALDELQMEGVDILVEMLDLCREDPDQTTARLLERFRDSFLHPYLGHLAHRDTHVVDDNEVRVEHFREIIHTLLDRLRRQRHNALLEKSRRRPLEPHEKDELLSLQQERLAPAVLSE